MANIACLGWLRGLGSSRFDVRKRIRNRIHQGTYFYVLDQRIWSPAIKYLPTSSVRPTVRRQMFPPPQFVIKSLGTVQDTKTGCCQAFLLRPTTSDGKHSIPWLASWAWFKPFRREEADSQQTTSGHIFYVLDQRIWSPAIKYLPTPSVRPTVRWQMFPPPQSVIKSLGTVQDTKTGCCQAFLLRPTTTSDGKHSMPWLASWAWFKPFRHEEADSQQTTSGHIFLRA